LPRVQVKGISKHFGDVIANKDISLDLVPGEVHALLGENGAGKSTLINILSGMYHPDSGEILIDEKPVRIHSPLDAIALGIGTLYQHFMLWDSLTVAENIVLGSEGHGAILRVKDVVEKINRLSQNYGLNVDPNACVWQLTVGAQQRVELVRILYHQADIIILDEPTAVLGPQEVDSLGEILKALAAEGKTILFVTHKLDEVMRFSHQVTVLRDGRNAGTFRTEEVRPEQLAVLMVGHQVPDTIGKSHPLGQTVLEVSNLAALNARGLPALNGVSFSVRAGEIVGIGGVEGNGQEELASIITGLWKAQSGTVTLNGAGVTNATPSFIAKVMGYIPSDRIGTGLIPRFSLALNTTLRRQTRDSGARRWFLDLNAIRQRAQALIDTYRVHPSDPDLPARHLSGGNQQRLLIGREVSQERRLIVAAQPTRGLDIDATYQVHQLFVDLSIQQVAILVVSTDLEELLRVCHRILILSRGEIAGTIDPDTTDRTSIGMLLAGRKGEPRAV
jgi:general nucleoside transport system ATP-binding protein